LASRIVRLLLALLVVALLAVTGISVYAASVMTTGNHKPIDQALSAKLPTVRESVSFNSRESGLLLKGWVFKAANPTGRSFVFVHGWMGNRIEVGFEGIANDLLAHGYDVLMFDLRSCGESQGDRFTIGNKEDSDVLGAYDFMKARSYDPHTMTFLGVSMGAASLIEAANRMTDVGAIVIDSTFSYLRPILERELPKRTNLPNFMNSAILLAGPVFGMNADLKPEDAVRALPKRAFLFFHGTGDTFITPDNAERLKAASSNPDSKLLILKAGQHVKTYNDNPELYMSTLYSFLDQQLAK